MPTYEYSCEKCGPFEIWQSIKDDALTACPTCGSKVERLLSANVGFILKGSGFYQNDYKNKAASRPEKKDLKSGTGPSTGSTASTSSPQGSSPQVGPGQGCGACGGPDPCPAGGN